MLYNYLIFFFFSFLFFSSVFDYFITFCPLKNHLKFECGLQPHLDLPLGNYFQTVKIRICIKDVNVTYTKTEENI